MGWCKKIRIREEAINNAVLWHFGQKAFSKCGRLANMPSLQPHIAKQNRNSNMAYCKTYAFTCGCSLLGILFYKMWFCSSEVKKKRCCLNQRTFQWRWPLDHTYSNDQISQTKVRKVVKNNWYFCTPHYKLIIQAASAPYMHYVQMAFRFCPCSWLTDDSKCWVFTFMSLCVIHICRASFHTYCSTLLVIIRW